MNDEAGQLVGIESQVDVQKHHEALHEQAGTNEQNNGQCDLRRDQKVPEPGIPRTDAASFLGFVKGVRERRPRRAPRWKQAKQEHRESRHPDIECKQPAIERNASNARQALRL